MPTVTEYCHTCGRRPIPGTNYCWDHTDQTRNDWDSLLTDQEKAFVMDGGLSVDLTTRDPKDVKIIVRETMRLWQECYRLEKGMAS